MGREPDLSLETDPEEPEGSEHCSLEERLLDPKAGSRTLTSIMQGTSPRPKPERSRVGTRRFVTTVGARRRSSHSVGPLLM